MKPGGTIITDCWKAYPAAAEAANVTHFTVNHSKGFKDYETGHHTNNVEGIHGVIKRDARAQFNRLPYLNKDGDSYYLDLLVWRANARLEKQHLFRSWCTALWSWTNTPLEDFDRRIPVCLEEEEDDNNTEDDDNDGEEEAGWFLDPEEVDIDLIDDLDEDFVP